MQQERSAFLRRALYVGLFVLSLYGTLVLLGASSSILTSLAILYAALIVLYELVIPAWRGNRRALLFIDTLRAGRRVTDSDDESVAEEIPADLDEPDVDRAQTFHLCVYLCGLPEIDRSGALCWVWIERNHIYLQLMADDGHDAEGEHEPAGLPIALIEEASIERAHRSDALARVYDVGGVGPGSRMQYVDRDALLLTIRWRSDEGTPVDLLLTTDVRTNRTCLEGVADELDRAMRAHATRA